MKALTNYDIEQIMGALESNNVGKMEDYEFWPLTYEDVKSVALSLNERGYQVGKIMESE